MIDWLKNAWTLSLDWIDAHFLPFLDGWRTYAVGWLMFVISMADQYDLTGMLNQLGLDPKTVSRVSLAILFLRLITARPKG